MRLKHTKKSVKREEKNEQKTCNKKKLTKMTNDEKIFKELIKIF